VLGKYSALLVVVALTTALLCVRMRVKRGEECMMLTLPLHMSGLSFLDCDGLVSCCGLLHMYFRAQLTSVCDGVERADEH